MSCQGQIAACLAKRLPGPPSTRSRFLFSSNTHAVASPPGPDSRPSLEQVNFSFHNYGELNIMVSRFSHFTVSQAREINKD